MASWFVADPDERGLCAWLGAEAKDLQRAAEELSFRDFAYTVVAFEALPRGSPLPGILYARDYSKLDRCQDLAELASDAMRKASKQSGVTYSCEWSRDTPRKERYHFAPPESAAGIAYGSASESKHVFVLAASEYLWHRIWPEMYQRAAGRLPHAPPTNEVSTRCPLHRSGYPCDCSMEKRGPSVEPLKWFVSAPDSGGLYKWLDGEAARLKERRRAHFLTDDAYTVIAFDAPAHGGDPVLPVPIHVEHFYRLTSEQYINDLACAAVRDVLRARGVHANSVGYHDTTRSPYLVPPCGDAAVARSFGKREEGGEVFAVAASDGFWLQSWPEMFMQATGFAWPNPTSQQPRTHEQVVCVTTPTAQARRTYWNSIPSAYGYR